MMEKLKLKFQKFSNALLSLEAIYLKPTVEDRSNIDASIRRFVFSFELFWKFLKEYFFQMGLEINYPRDIIKEAFSLGMINDETLWLQMLKDRHLTSHTYDQHLADTIFSNIQKYTPMIRAVLDFLEEHDQDKLFSE